MTLSQEQQQLFKQLQGLCKTQITNAFHIGQWFHVVNEFVEVLINIESYLALTKVRGKEVERKRCSSPTSVVIYVKNTLNLIPCLGYQELNVADLPESQFCKVDYPYTYYISTNCAGISENRLTPCGPCIKMKQDVDSHCLDCFRQFEDIQDLMSALKNHIFNVHIDFAQHNLSKLDNCYDASRHKDEPKTKKRKIKEVEMETEVSEEEEVDDSSIMGQLVPEGGVKEFAEEETDFLDEDDIVLERGFNEVYDYDIMQDTTKCDTFEDHSGATEPNTSEVKNSTEEKQLDPQHTSPKDHQYAEKSEQKATGNLSCLQCNEKFTKPFFFEKHVKQRHPRQEFITCNDCSKDIPVTNSDFQFTEHVRICDHNNMTPVRNFKPSKPGNDGTFCPICQVPTPRADVRQRRHKKTIHLKMPLSQCQAEDCQTMFESFYNYEDHMLECHKEMGSITCMKCSMNVPIDKNETWFVDHFLGCKFQGLKLRTQKRGQGTRAGLRCTNSSIRSIDDGVANRMSSIVATPLFIEENEPGISCKMCPRKFRSNEALKVHERKAHNFNFTICSICSDEFYSTVQLQEHMKKDHEEVATLECWLCLQDINTYQLTNHLNACIFFRIGEKMGKIKCSICDKAFFRGKSYREPSLGTC